MRNVEKFVDELLGKPVILEVGISRIFRHFHSTPLGIVTAYKSDNPQPENVANNKLLEKDIQELGKAFAKVAGMWTNPETRQMEGIEPGFLIIGISIEDIVALGKKYNQYSVYWSDGKGQAEEIRTDTGEIVGEPKTNFKVFTDPSEVSGGTLLKRKAGQKRGISFTETTTPITLKVRFGSPPPVGKDLEGEPGFGFRLGWGKKATDKTIFIGPKKENLHIPVDELYIVEFDMTDRDLARYALPRVALGTLVEGNEFAFIRNDGMISRANVADRITKWARLFKR